jgi:hypothetical protein
MPSKHKRPSLKRPSTRQNDSRRLPKKPVEQRGQLKFDFTLDMNLHADPPGDTSPDTRELRNASENHDSEPPKTEVLKGNNTGPYRYRTDSYDDQEANQRYLE